MRAHVPLPAPRAPAALARRCRPDLCPWRPRAQVRPTAAAYLEFVERKPLPQHAALPASQLTERHRRDGFEAASADKIFESTTLAAGGIGRDARLRRP